MLGDIGKLAERALKGTSRKEMASVLREGRSIKNAMPATDEKIEMILALNGAKEAGRPTGLLNNLANVPTDEYISGALRGSLGWGAYGGVNEWAHGGSFWEGAKGGLFRGAFIGAGFRAYKNAPFSTYQPGRTARQAYKQWGNVSRQVEALGKLEANVAKAKQVTGGGGV
jgi:hypothetical protein